MTEKTVKTEKTANAFDVQTIIASKRYHRYADILRCVLEDGKFYTHEDIDKLLKKTLAQPVKKNINN